MNKVNRQKGFSQIILLVIISFLAVALPVTIRLVQKSQENRSSAATESTYSGGGCSSYTGPSSCNAVKGCSWDGIAGLGVCRGTPVTPGVTPINGACGNSKDVCSAGTFQDATDTPSNYYWNCLGVNGGTNKYGCIAKKSSGSDGCGTGLYTCNNGVTAVKEDPVGANFKWKCGTVSCSMPFSTCAGGDRPLGCNCGVNSDCSSNSCYKSVCVSQGCKYAGSYISVGQSQCFNAFFGAYSDLVRCDIVNGKPKAFIVKSYKKANCEGIESDGSGLGCTYGKTTLVDGQHQCFNVFMKSGVFSGSVMIACDNGVPRTETRFPRKNCAEGNDNADDDVDTPTADDDETGNTTTTKFYYGKNCTEGSFTSYSDCTSKTGYNCFNSKDVCLAYYGIKYDLYSKSGATCDSSTGNWKCTHITNSSKPGDGVTTFTDESACEGASGCEKSSGPGPGPGPGDYSVCTANTVSTTECYDSTHLKKCNSDGTAWIQGDQCPTNQACQNGVCGGVGAKLSFKFAFDGVAPANLECLDNFKTVTLTVGKVGTTLVQEMSTNVTKTDLTNSKGYAIFGADNVALGTGFSGASNVYVKIKGQVHARMYYCVKSQSAKNTSQICNLSLDGTVNNFYEYPVLAGDVDQNGVVNTADFSVIKTALFTTGCGVKTDLNGDGIVNEFDVKLFKVALEAKYDE